MGTLYRHFPKHLDLILAVFRREVDACTDAGQDLAARHEPLEALTLGCCGTPTSSPPSAGSPRGCTPATRPTTPCRATSPAARPTLQALLDSAAVEGVIRPVLDAEELLDAVSRLCMPGPVGETLQQSYCIVRLLVDGLRFNAPR